MQDFLKGDSKIFEGDFNSSMESQGLGVQPLLIEYSVL